MKDKKTLKEIFVEARRAKHDSFVIARNPEVLDSIKTLAEKRGDLETAKEIGEQIDRLRGLHTKEKILEFLEKDHIYYSANRLSISALYDWNDVKKEFDEIISGGKRKRPKPSSWAVCRETDEINDIEFYDEDKILTLHIPIDHFDNIGEAVDRFNFLYGLEVKGVNTSKRCGDCRWFTSNGVCGSKSGLYDKKDIGCEEYEYEEKEDYEEV